ncbi:MAG: hypothetical protein JWP13_742, partial [Candidatus Saccharibacteria bacterium]|nr:hypothetical protein [Candidatus Saccharibacteria bacterium]
MAMMVDLRYEVINSKNLTPAQHRDINRLLFSSLRADFPDRSVQDLGMLVAESALNRRNPNMGVGGAALSAHQSYARAIHVLAIDGDHNLVAELPSADTAS